MMFRNLTLLRNALSLSVLTILAVLPVMAQDAAQPRRFDMSKTTIEGPSKVLLQESAPAEGKPSVSVNPKVMPGLVNWHSNYAAAVVASRQSKKPVLLFQMMGRLDEKFC